VIANFIAGTLAPASDSIESHVAGYAECRQLVAELSGGRMRSQAR
jgi:hypothetical protein